ncbi:MAG TPA: DUF4399 domain-containing protein, partial [Casimicrobium sp.]|nr:DUF4399 domain-containing protein [Casimicrobium sp.]
MTWDTKTTTARSRVLRSASRWLFVGAALIGMTTSQVIAAPAFTNPLEARCWATYSKERTVSDRSDGTRSVGFANIRDGMRIYSPFRAEFAIRGMGVVPAGKQREGTGHQHILIDTKLPVDVQASMPFSDKYQHYGKGQTNATLTLAPGKHTLRLLFADFEHKPYYVFSREMRIEVIAPRSSLATTGAPRVNAARFDETCKAWYENTITEPSPAGTPAYFQNVRDEDRVQSPFVLRFGAEGLGVCAANVDVEKTGHFVLEVLKRDAVQRRITLADGQTQFEFEAEPGTY